MEPVGGFQNSLQKELFEKISKKNVESFLEKWDKSLRWLQSDDFNLNFIEVTSNTIAVEEVYLEKVVIPEQSIYNIYEEINKLYPEKKDRAEFGFFTRIHDFNILFANISYNESISLLEKMRKEGLTPNVDSYNYLINKAPNKNKAYEHFNEILVKFKYPNENTLIELIRKENDFEKGFAILEDSKKYNLVLTTNIFEPLVELTIDENKEYKLIDFYINELKSKDNYLFNLLIKKQVSYENAKKILDLLVSYNITPNIYSYGPLISKSPNYSTAYKNYLELLQFDDKPTTSIYNRLISMTDSFITASTIVEEMFSNSIKIETKTINMVLSKCNKLDDALNFYYKNKNRNVGFDVYTFNAILNTVNNQAELDKVMNKFPFDISKYNEVTNSILIKKSKDLKQAIEVLDNAINQNSPINIVAFNCLLKMASNDSEIELILKRIKEYEVIPSSLTLLEILNKTNNKEMIFNTLSVIINAKNEELGSIVFNKLKDICQDFKEDVYELLFKYFDPTIIFNEQSLNRLLLELGLNESNRTDFINKYLSEIKEVPDSIKTFYVKYYIHNDLYKEANQILSLVENKNWRYYSLLSLTKRDLSFEDAMEFYEIALEHALTDEEKGTTYNNMAIHIIENTEEKIITKAVEFSMLAYKHLKFNKLAIHPVRNILKILSSNISLEEILYSKAMFFLNNSVSPYILNQLKVEYPSILNN